ncbi:MAG TPA: hypothetical protein VLH40_03840 [Atribacteraceae bacterium]|nr:hypothetical protein [Atribacteraceae bacterium]
MKRKMLIPVLLVVLVFLSGCGGTVLPPDVYRVRNMLVSYYHSLLRLDYHGARAHLVPGGETDRNFATIYREFQAFRSWDVERYDETTVRIVHFAIDLEGDTAFIHSFVVSYCDWKEEEEPPEFFWSGSCGQCPGFCGELRYVDFNGTARLIDGWWRLA